MVFVMNAIQLLHNHQCRMVSDCVDQGESLQYEVSEYIDVEGEHVIVSSFYAVAINVKMCREQKTCFEFCTYVVLTHL